MAERPPEQDRAELDRAELDRAELDRAELDRAELDRAELAAAYARSNLRLAELWLAYFALGGNAGQYEVEAYLTGLTELGDYEHNILAHALNEELADRGSAARAPYREPDL